MLLVVRLGLAKRRGSTGVVWCGVVWNDERERTVMV